LPVDSVVGYSVYTILIDELSPENTFEIEFNVMKKIILAGLICLLCTTAGAAGNTYQLGVDGLACPFCTYGIEKQLHKLEGVAGLETDIARGLIEVSMHEGKALTEAEVEQAVQKAGFKLRSFSPAQ